MRLGTGPTRAQEGTPCVPRAGFTLIELLLCLGLMTLLGVVLLTFQQASADGMAMISAQGTLRMQLAQALTAINQDAEAAMRQSSPACGLTASSSRLFLQVPSLDSSGNIMHGTFDTICYNRTTDNQLQRIIVANGPGRTSTSVPPPTVARYITTATFAWPAPTRLSVTLAAGKSEGRRTFREPPLNDLVAEFALRNRLH